MDRLFEIHPTALNVTISKLTIREGFSDDAGAGIQNWSPGPRPARGRHVKDNLASKSGGGVNQAEPSEYTCPLCLPLVLPGGRMEIVDSTLSGNASGGGGAAINNAGSGTVLIERSDIVDNPGEMIVDPEYHPDPTDPSPDPPPLVPAPGVYEPDSSAIDNQAEFDVVGTIHIVDSTIDDNYAHHDGAGVSNSGHGILTIERLDLQAQPDRGRRRRDLLGRRHADDRRHDDLRQRGARRRRHLQRGRLERDRPAQPRRRSPTRRSPATTPSCSPSRRRPTPPTSRRPTAAAWCSTATRT